MQKHAPYIYLPFKIKSSPNFFPLEEKFNQTEEQNISWTITGSCVE